MELQTFRPTGSEGGDGSNRHRPNVLLATALVLSMAFLAIVFVALSSAAEIR